MKMVELEYTRYSLLKKALHYTNNDLKCRFESYFSRIRKMAWCWNEDNLVLETKIRKGVRVQVSPRLPKNKSNDS